MSLPTVRDYRMLEKIGTGSYATVYKALKKDESREAVAVKCVDKGSLSKSAVDNLVTEIKLLNVLKHEHIVEMKDFFWDEGHIYIVMEYCDGGDLSSFIKKKHKLPESTCRRFLQQLALALRYLRDHNVCHMDLKPQNLLLMRKPQLVLKVGDFGFAQYLSSSEHKFTIRGSPLYMAPEMLLRHKYDARVDLWSVGVIMYECLFGKAPYSSSSFQELAEKIKSSRPIEIPKAAHVSAMCKDLLMALLKHNPADRVTYDEFFAHDFLDLEHAPTKENYEKAAALVYKAVEMDAEKNAKEAFYLYCEALRYFIPILTNESDLKRKEVLRHRVNDYIRRAETLKVAFIDGNNERRSAPESKSNITSLQRISSLEKSSPFTYNELPLIRGSLLGLDYMSKHKGGKGGTIVNIASLASLGPFFCCPVYTSSKYAVLGFSLTLEKFYDKTGVRILTMCPSFTSTPIVTFQKENIFHDVIDDDFFKNNLPRQFYTPQSAAHVGQSTVTVIQKGKNGSFWIVDKNEPPYSIEVPSHTLD